MAADPARVFVAPHFDDVALSCGGQVALAARVESPRVITIFGGVPATSSGEFARFQHARWGLRDEAVIATRRREDACAAAALGARVRTRWFGWLDAIYRDPAYDSDDALFGDVRSTDAQLVTEIADALERLHGTHYFVPLAVGNHVDHQLTFEAGARLAQRGANVWAYVDIPYAFDDRHVEARLAAVDLGGRQVMKLDPEAWERKWRAIACYASQLPVLFRDYPDARDALDRHARRVGQGVWGEETWRVMA